ncbi:MAG: hypothetical protein HC846_04970 [Blastocatellia bacterium]|nr:hypothetical protein [Blastocatellia bacterium]
MEANFLRSKKMPLVIEPKRKDRSLNSLIETALSNKDIFLSQLLRYGALLFRGFEVQTAEDFTDFVKRFSGKEFFNYAGGASPRSLISGKVYNSTDYPPELMLELHNELSYSKHYPQHLYFFCETAPEKGGETILGDSRQILRRIRPKIAGLFKHKNILYERNLSANADSPYSWQKAFETEDKQLVEEICRQTGVGF